MSSRDSWHIPPGVIPLRNRRAVPLSGAGDVLLLTLGLALSLIGIGFLIGTKVWRKK